MNTYIILRRNGWASGPELEAAAARSTEIAGEMAADIRWLRSYVLGEADGSLGSVCVYQATSEAKVREHASCAGLPADEVIQVNDLMIINPDPREVDAGD